MTRIISAEFTNYKGLRDFTISLLGMNVLVGPNNAGKSTVISAFKLLAAGLRTARSRAPAVISVDGDARYGWLVPTDELDVSVENVHSDLDDSSTDVVFGLANGDHLRLHFPPSRGCVLVAEAGGAPVRTAAAFKKAFPISVEFVPTLGPVEHREQLLERATVRRGLHTHRASRQFRSYWFHHPEGFEDFAAKVEATWPGMVIEPPERVSPLSPELAMFCREDGMTRELFWVGFGFQVWCQLLTHVVRASGSTLLVMDEPETYLHPDLQRQLLGLVRGLGPDILLATHSSELMAEAEHAELLLVDKRNSVAARLGRPEQVQRALEDLGSAQNITLAQLARNRRVLFVRGADFRLLRGLARRLGLVELGNGLGIVPIHVEGPWEHERVGQTIAGIDAILGRRVLAAGLFDRGLQVSDDTAAGLAALQRRFAFTHVLLRPRLESYLLEPSVIERAVRAIAAPARLASIPLNVEALLLAATEPLRGPTFDRHAEPDPNSAALAGWAAVLEARWATWAGRVTLVDGRAAFDLLRVAVNDQYGVILNETVMIAALRPEEIPPELAGVLQELDRFRRCPVG
jgi:energy-coupling factor transporter ATP-binding protein EcfA2